MDEAIVAEIESNEKELISIISQFKKKDIFVKALDLFREQKELEDSEIGSVETKETNLEYLMNHSWFAPHYIICLAIMNKQDRENELIPDVWNDISRKAKFNSVLIFSLHMQHIYQIWKQGSQYGFMCLLPEEQKYSKFYEQIIRRQETREVVDMAPRIKESHDSFGSTSGAFADKTGFFPESIYGFLYAFEVEAQKQADTNQDQVYVDKTIIVEKSTVERWFSRVYPHKKKKHLRM